MKTFSESTSVISNWDSNLTNMGLEIIGLSVFHSTESMQITFQVYSEEEITLEHLKNNTHVSLHDELIAVYGLPHDGTLQNIVICSKC